MPAPCRLHNFLDAAVFGLPMEFLCNFFAGGNEPRRIASTAFFFLYHEVTARYFLDGIDDFPDRKSRLGSQIIDPTCTALDKMVQGKDMSGGQVLHMDVVPEARAVRGVVVRTKDGNSIALTQSGLDGQGNEMGFRIMVFPRYFPKRDAPAALK